MAAYVEGLGAIARHIGMYDRGTIESYATRNFDPLPLRLRGKSVRVREDRLDLWRRRNAARKRRKRDADLPFVEGMPAVARAAGMTLEKAKRMANRANDPLPVEPAIKGRRWAYVSALQDWIDRADLPYSLLRNGPSGRRKRWIEREHQTATG